MCPRCSGTLYQSINVVGGRGGSDGSVVIGGRQHERSNNGNGSYDGEKEVVEEEVDGKNNETIMALGVSGRQKSAGKDGDRHNDGNKEVIDGNDRNNATTGRVYKNADGGAVVGSPSTLSVKNVPVGEGSAGWPLQPRPAPVTPQPPSGRCVGRYRAPPGGTRQRRRKRRSLATAQ